jgi:hypothetical protein
MRTVTVFTTVAIAGSLLMVACGKKKAPETQAAIEGWHQETGWKGSCYYPKDYKSSDRVAASAVREAMLSQWRGERDDGVSFSSNVIESVETVLLGKPDAVKGVARKNLDHCKKVMAGGDIGAWQTWFSGLSASLTEGDCKWPPLRYQQHDYLDIGQGWQFEGFVCEGDKIRMEVSALDYYRLSDSGPWINAAGDTNQRAVGNKYPCTLEECFVGTVIYRFTAEDGTISIGAVGTGIEWTAPQNGELHLRVNDDDTFFDNVWRKKGSLIDHAAVAYIGVDEG